jgi:hypothetical protein
VPSAPRRKKEEPAGPEGQLLIRVSGAYLLGFFLRFPVLDALLDEGQPAVDVLLRVALGGQVFLEAVDNGFRSLDPS